MSLVDRILRRRSHYRETFKQGSASAQFVLGDLRRFCKIGEPVLSIGANGQTDIYATGMAAGRQEVFLRIVAHLHLDDAQLLKLKETYDDNQ